MDDIGKRTTRFPSELVDWAGHHSGGVKRLFDSHSGRPGKDLLRTNLLSRLESWAGQLAAGAPDVPRLLLLVGGPGNGKTEAIESTIRWLDEKLACGGQLVDTLSQSFHVVGGVPRIVGVDAGSLAKPARPLVLDIVQDASSKLGDEGKSAPSLLIEELGRLLGGHGSHAYLCCVNRGVLDDALIHALENDLEEPRILLEAITRAVSLAPDAPSCWPLQGFPSIAVWPMDAESLLVRPDGEASSPAEILLKQATAADSWPAPGSCAAGDKCPFCNSQALLAKEGPREALLRILRWYELGSGKRWSFRDLFSLISYLLAGHRPAGQERQADPCEWAARLVELDKSLMDSKPRKQSRTAIYYLATSSYQHALFHRWDKSTATLLKEDLKGLGLEDDHTLAGLHLFLHERRAPYLPAPITPLLEGLMDLLDPAMASPDMEVALSGRTDIVLRELDTRFSRSIGEGIEYIRRSQALSPVELDLLKRLAEVDSRLSWPVIRRKKPAAASRVQRTLRDFACRLVRRSICTRSAVVADAEILKAFQLVVEDDAKSHRLYEVAEQVERLLNKGQDFEVSLTTTFGQPLPPSQRQATLVVPSRQVGMCRPSREGRPLSPISFLEVGQGQSAQPIALTYDLFKAVKELERGMSPASLPRTVVALLDTTRARLAGPIVRDDEILRRSKIRVGTDGTVIAKSWDGFVSRNEKTRS